MNVLIDGLTPKVCSLKEVLRAFLDHRREVLLRRSRHRMGKIDHRLEVLAGLITAFLNLDRVIDIIRYDDDPKAALMYEDWSVPHQATMVRATSERDYRSPLAGVDPDALALIADPGALPTGVLAEDAPEGQPSSYAGRENGLSDVQAEAILNMRLRSLRRLEEEALVTERDALMVERAGLEDLLEDEAVQWAAIAGQLRETRKAFGAGAPGGARRTGFAEAAELPELSRRGDDRARAGDRRLLRDGLGPRAARPPAAGGRAEVQGRRPRPLHLPRRDDGPDPGLRLERAALHGAGGATCPAAAAWASRCG